MSRPKKSTTTSSKPDAERFQATWFKSLCAQIDGGHFKNALKTCDKILRVDANDIDALNAKLFLLLQTDQYGDALSLVDSLSDPEQRDFEKAYALYRLHREEDASEYVSRLKGSLKGEDEKRRGVTHLEAQLAYRRHAYEDAFDLYTQLLDSSTSNSEEHEDLITNLNAAQTQLDFLTNGYLHALDALPGSVSANLETAPPPVPPGSAVAIASVPVAAQAPLTSTRKVRMKRVPKGVVPGVTPPPDPERWVKKSERSTFGQGAGRRRKAAGGGATQGSAAVDQPVAVAASHAAKSSKGKKKK